MTGWPLLPSLACLAWLSTPAMGYELHYLPGLPGAASSAAYAVNNRGQVVGWCYADGRRLAVIWDDAGAHSLGCIPGDDYSEALDINNRGQVVGSSGGKAFVWDERHGMREIPAPGRAVAINDAGQVVLSGHVYSLNQRDGIVVLDPLYDSGEVARWPRAYDINNSGTSVGFIDFGSFPRHSYGKCVWRRDGSVLMSTRQGSPGIGSIFMGINNGGTCVGFMYGMVYIFFRPEAIVWDPHLGTRRLMGAPGTPYHRREYSAACDINERGEIVGYVQEDYPLMRKWAAFRDRAGAWRRTCHQQCWSDSR